MSSSTEGLLSEIGFDGDTEEFARCCGFSFTFDDWRGSGDGEGAIFGVWEGKRGLFPLGGSACRLPRQIPYTIAMDILLSSRPVTAIEAKEIGLIGRVVPNGEALNAARAVAAQAAECG